MKRYYCYRYNISYYNENTKDIEVLFFYNYTDLKNSDQFKNDRKNCRIIKFRHYYDK